MQFIGASSSLRAIFNLKILSTFTGYDFTFIGCLLKHCTRHLHTDRVGLDHPVHCKMKLRNDGPQCNCIRCDAKPIDCAMFDRIANLTDLGVTST